MIEMQELTDYRQALLARFAGLPGELKSTVHKFPRTWLHLPLEAGGWSVHQVIAHLRDMERHAYLVRIEQIIAQELPQLAVFDARAWTAEHYRPSEPLASILDEFAALRKRELDCLSAMPPTGWSRQGRHPIYGLRSLLWWVERCLAHSEEHLRYVQKALQDPHPIS